MSWWIYENWRAGKRKAVLHESSCRCCNNGKGMANGKADSKNGKWHGSFSTVSEAVMIQEGLAVQVRQRCSFCIK